MNSALSFLLLSHLPLGQPSAFFEGFPPQIQQQVSSPEFGSTEKQKKTISIWILFLILDPFYFRKESDKNDRFQRNTSLLLYLPC